MGILHKAAAVFNGAVLLSIVAIGAYGIKEASAKEQMSTISSEDKYCLQQNLYFEARNISDLSMEAIAWVTLNRVDSSRYPDSICGVVWQPKQFSWTHDGKSDRPSSNVLEQRAWKRAGVIAEKVLNQYVRGKAGPIGAADHYHADSVSPVWRHQLIRVAQIDNHIYYASN